MTQIPEIKKHLLPLIDKLPPEPMAEKKYDPRYMNSRFVKYVGENYQQSHLMDGDFFILNKSMVYDDQDNTYKFEVNLYELLDSKKVYTTSNGLKYHVRDYIKYSNVYIEDVIKNAEALHKSRILISRIERVEQKLMGLLTMTEIVSPRNQNVVTLVNRFIDNVKKQEFKFTLLDKNIPYINIEIDEEALRKIFIKIEQELKTFLNNIVAIYGLWGEGQHIKVVNFLAQSPSLIDSPYSILLRLDNCPQLTMMQINQLKPFRNEFVSLITLIQGTTNHWQPVLSILNEMNKTIGLKTIFSHKYISNNNFVKLIKYFTTLLPKLWTFCGDCVRISSAFHLVKHEIQLGTKFTPQTIQRIFATKEAETELESMCNDQRNRHKSTVDFKIQINTDPRFRSIWTYSVNLWLIFYPPNKFNSLPPTKMTLFRLLHLDHALVNLLHIANIHLTSCQSLRKERLFYRLAMHLIRLQAKATHMINFMHDRFPGAREAKTSIAELFAFAERDIVVDLGSSTITNDWMDDLFSDLNLEIKNINHHLNRILFKFAYKCLPTNVDLTIMHKDTRKLITEFCTYNFTPKDWSNLDTNQIIFGLVCRDRPKLFSPNHRRAWDDRKKYLILLGHFWRFANFTIEDLKDVLILREREIFVTYPNLAFKEPCSEITFRELINAFDRILFDLMHMTFRDHKYLLCHFIKEVDDASHHKTSRDINKQENMISNNKNSLENDPPKNE